MRRRIGLSLILIFLTTIGWMVWKSIDKLDAKKMREESISIIPNLNIESVDGKVYNLRKIAVNKKSLLLILYNSDCNHCQYEAKIISANLSKFQDIQLVFLTDEPIQKVIEFATQYFPRTPDAIFGRTSIVDIVDVFKEISYPNI